MAWTVSVIGRAPAVADAAAKAFAACKPDGKWEKETLDSAASVVACLLGCYPTDGAVKVDASGSQDVRTPKAPPFTSQFSLTVTPIYGFVG